VAISAVANLAPAGSNDGMLGGLDVLKHVRSKALSGTVYLDVARAMAVRLCEWNEYATLGGPGLAVGARGRTPNGCPWDIQGAWNRHAVYMTDVAFYS